MILFNGMYVGISGFDFSQLKMISNVREFWRFITKNIRETKFNGKDSDV